MGVMTGLLSARRIGQMKSCWSIITYRKTQLLLDRVQEQLISSPELLRKASVLNAKMAAHTMEVAFSSTLMTSVNTCAL
jgi:hypothetical protein